jgi:DNA-binding CsgD family transcriptional regulator
MTDQSNPLVRWTPLERTVLEQLLACRTNKEIAQTLHLSPFTVREYVQRIALKLGCRNRVAIVAACAGRPPASLHTNGSAAVESATESGRAVEACRYSAAALLSEAAEFVSRDDELRDVSGGQSA